MEVTEGKASKRGRKQTLVLALALSAAVVALFCLVPVVMTPVLWLAVAFAAFVTSRYCLLSVVASFMRHKLAAEPGRRPSIAFVIPCLNELPSLQHTVPAMAALRYDGELLLCYSCESASTDGSMDYLRDEAEKNPSRIHLIEKETRPGGRGAAIAYGLTHAPRTDVVGFLDADHIVGQESLDEIARVFGADDPPWIVQGVCATADESHNWLARLLTVERLWLERVELRVATKLGGLSQFGGGQGFFRRELLDDPRFVVDGSMILDDTDLSCRLALAGHKVKFDQDITTKSREPETLTEFLDQRFRWGRGWVQLVPKYFVQSFRCPGAPLATRLALLSFVLTPLLAAWLYLSFLAGATALVPGLGVNMPIWLPAVGLLWPFALGVGPFLSGVRPVRFYDVPLVLVGVPLLLYTYCWLVAVSVVDAFILRRKPSYAKTAKPEVK